MPFQPFKSLFSKSIRIQEEIDREQQRRWPDWMRLLKLKRLRLAIKDRMARFASGKDIRDLQWVRIKASHSKKSKFKTLKTRTFG